MRNDIEIVRGAPLIRKDLVDRTRGFVSDIKTREIAPVGTVVD